MDNFIFWRQPLCVTGPATTTQAEARLQAMLHPRKFSMQDRLAGSLREHHLKAWKSSTAAFAGDVVEFEGTLHADQKGTVIDGQLRYKTRTRIQFVGLLVMGLGFVVIGAFHKLSGAPPGGDLLGMGAAVCFITLFGIYASAQMRHTQVDFITARLNEIVAL